MKIDPQNSRCLAQELDWLESVLHARMGFLSKKEFLFEEFLHTQAITTAMPLYEENNSYTQLLARLHKEGLAFWELSAENKDATFVSIAQRIILLMALAPHVRPALLDIFRATVQGLEPAQFGGVRPTGHFKGFLPTGETLVHILASENIYRRKMVETMLQPTYPFAQKNILYLEKLQNPYKEPFLTRQVLISENCLHWLTTGKEYEPQFSPDFPAERLTTQQTWSDLVADEGIQKKIIHLKHWIKNFKQLEAVPVFGKERRGYKCLFSGIPGTGKTMTVKLLTLETESPIFRISTDKIISKYVGETTKNIARIFRDARTRDWILFFDEGEALFGRRSKSTNSANDVFVNQDIAYLLQQIEEYPGIVLVATNHLDNVDEAFLRRFDTLITFQTPKAGERLALWQKAMEPFELDPLIDLREVAEKVKTTGAIIQKIKHFIGIEAVTHGSWKVSVPFFLYALHYHKLSSNFAFTQKMTEKYITENEKKDDTPKPSHRKVGMTPEQIKKIEMDMKKFKGGLF